MISTLVLSLALTLTAPAAVITPPCAFGRAQTLQEGTTLADQLRCYMTSGRKVSIVGTFFESSVSSSGISGGNCIRAIVADRFQVSSCGNFNTDAALTIPYSAISYIADDPSYEAVTIYLNRPPGR